jgi:hypothetical protein
MVRDLSSMHEVLGSILIANIVKKTKTVLMIREELEKM